MSREKKARPKRLSKNTKHFLQPLALVFISAVFILLVLVTSVMDLKRSDRTLIGFMQNRGFDIIANIQRSAQSNYTILFQLPGNMHSAEPVSPFAEESFLPQERLTQELVGLGQYIDRAWPPNQFGREDAVRLAQEEHLQFIAIINRHSQISLQTGPVPRAILRQAAPVIEGQKDITIELFDKRGEVGRTGFIAIRKSAGVGTIIIALDQSGFQFWGQRVAIQRAIESTGWGKDILYLTVMNREGQLLDYAGYIDDAWKAEALNDLKRRTDTTENTYRKLTYQGRDVLEVIGPIKIGDQIIGTVRVGLDRVHADQLLSEYRTSMVISMAAIMIVGVMSIWLLFQNQNRHLKKIGEMNKRLQRSERLSSLGQLAAGVAHEIRNPLNAISMASQRMQREYLPLLEEERREPFKQLTGVVRDEIRRLNAIIEEFLTFSKTDRLELRDYPIEEVLQKIANLVEEEALARGVLIRRDWNSTRSIVAMDMDKLQQAFLNFIKNGIESISGQGEVSIGVHHTEDHAVLVRITDTGMGLKPDEIERIFNPEYTTKEQGLGLGLSIAHEIIRAHGGDIRVQSERGVGSTFEVRLPLKSI